MSKLISYDVLIVGAGAAGMMCAAVAGQRGRRVLLLDKADKPGKKILISGGGRCNFTNMYTEPSCYLSQNPHFCKSALARYTPWDFLALMEKHQLSWNEKTLGQLFCDQKSKAVVEMLRSECIEAGVEIRLNAEIDEIQQVAGGFEVQVGEQGLQAQSLVIATGGPSIPRMGATDFGLQVADQFGLKSIPFAPALVPFTFSQADLEGIFADLSGVSVEVRVGFADASFRENMLFTHRGLSGPAMLQISSYWQQGKTIQIDLYPDGNLSEWLTEQQQERPKAELKTVLQALYSKRLAQRLCEQVIPNKPLQQYSPAELEQVAESLHQWELMPAGTEGMRTAEVASGGVDTQELSSKTFQSKKVDGLYFIGETVDVTGWLGGYNFQWAWASGWCAGQVV
uniref:NAD(FAD)-utilizing dehydrogenases n=1 Tax=uncultured Thiotrichaceae bacterium TaxID=298394 RepID=A0A6S6TPD8_9GAMM|nr:MAG: NAD(FAD)-utilizing dehydrogenases [uncultured Thiotrichaceae bacterium]